MTLIGCDISAYQDAPSTPKIHVDFNKMKAAGAKFAIMRAGYSNVVDREFVEYWNASYQAGLKRGMYFFWDYSLPNNIQIDFIKKMVSTYWVKGQDIPPALDLEYYSGYGGLPAKSYLTAYLYEIFSAVPGMMLYTNPSTIQYNLQYPTPTWLLLHPLWIANYGVEKPIFKPWTNWTFWQYSSKGDGLKYGVESLNIDMNYFNGTEQDLENFCGGGVVIPELTDKEKLDILWKEYLGQ